MNNNGMVLVLFILLVIIVSGFIKQNTKAGLGNPHMNVPSKPAGTLLQPTGSQPILATCTYDDVVYNQGSKLCLSNKCYECIYNGSWAPTGFSCGINMPC